MLSAAGIMLLDRKKPSILRLLLEFVYSHDGSHMRRYI